MSITKICSIEECKREVYARGWCSVHYQRWSRWGDPLKTLVMRHGGEGTPEYRIWIDIRRRCNDPGRPGFRDYGGRGIRICNRWIDFANFLTDMGKRPSPEHSIDRINNDGDYEPSNCRWATPKEQSNNRRSNHYITIEGETMTIAQWCEKYDIPDTTFHNRLRRGWRGQSLLSR